MQWFDTARSIPLLFHDDIPYTSFISNGPIIILNPNSRWGCSSIYWPYLWDVTYCTTALLHHNFRSRRWDVCISHPIQKDSVIILPIYHFTPACIELVSVVYLLLPRYSYHFLLSISAATTTTLLQTLIIVTTYALRFDYGHSSHLKNPVISSFFFSLNLHTQ